MAEKLSLAMHLQGANIHLSSFEIFLRYCVGWVQLQGYLKLQECFIQFPQIGQGDSIIQMRASKVRANADYCGKLRLRFLNFSYSRQFTPQ